MDARICTNPACHVIQPGAVCALCGSSTEDIPGLFLSPIGINGMARLTYSVENAYALCIETPTTTRFLHIPLPDLIQSSQPPLSGLNEVSGPTIMDALKSASNLIRSRNSSHWAGWIIYLVEALQGNATPITYQEMLRDLWQEVSSRLVENALSSEEA